MSIAKEDVMKWADGQTGIPTGHKFLLSKFASYADADGLSWSKIDLLSAHVNKDERTVQRWLLDLKRWGLIKDSGRKHRLDGSTRSVPLYRLQTEVWRLKGWESMGDTDVTHSDDASVTLLSPIENAWVTPAASMGDTAVTCIDPIDPNSFASLTQRAGEGAGEDLDEGFRALEAAVPKRMLAVSDPDTAFALFVELRGQGVAAETLVDCAARMGASDWWKSRRVPIPLEDWLRKRQFRGWMPDDETPVDPGSAEPAPGEFDAPAEVLGPIVARKGAAWVAAWLGQARWDPDRRAIVCRLSVQADRVRGELGTRWLADLGVQVDVAAKVLEGVR